MQINTGAVIFGRLSKNAVIQQISFQHERSVQTSLSVTALYQLLWLNEYKNCPLAAN